MTEIRQLWNKLTLENKQFKSKIYPFNDLQITSFSAFNDGIYSKDPMTPARGLFMAKINEEFKIVTRGYDKFFNGNLKLILKWMKNPGQNGIF